MVRKEGFGSFFKGLTPKILVVGPKLIFRWVTYVRVSSGG
jgi:hypothetical protein